MWERQRGPLLRSSPPTEVIRGSRSIVANLPHAFPTLTLVPFTRDAEERIEVSSGVVVSSRYQCTASTCRAIACTELD